MTCIIICDKNFTSGNYELYKTLFNSVIVPGDRVVTLKPDRDYKDLFIQNGIATENTKFVVNHFSHNGIGAVYEDMKKIEGIAPLQISSEISVYSTTDGLPFFLQNTPTFSCGFALTTDFEAICTFLSIAIPSSVTSIGNAAFSGGELETVEGASGVISIGNSAFSGNYNLKNIKIPNYSSTFSWSLLKPNLMVTPSAVLLICTAVVGLSAAHPVSFIILSITCMALFLSPTSIAS